MAVASSAEVAENPVEMPLAAEGLSALEREMVAVFADVGQALGLPRSYGEIYGLLYASPAPRSLADIEARPDLSKGSVSHLPQHDQEFTQVARAYRTRQLVKPGITGLAQVRGYRGEITDAAMLQHRVQLGIHCITHRSSWLNVQITLKVLWLVPSAQVGGVRWGQKICPGPAVGSGPARISHRGPIRSAAVALGSGKAARVCV